MSVALPIQLVAGDTGMYPCLITGGTITSAVLAIAVELADGYSYIVEDNTGKIKKDDVVVYTIPSGTYVEAVDNGKLIINVVQEVSSESTSNNVIFILDAAFTDSFKPGKYSYDILVKQSNELVSGEAKYTPIYTNAFNVLPRVNKIIIPVQVSS